MDPYFFIESLLKGSRHIHRHLYNFIFFDNEVCKHHPVYAETSVFRLPLCDLMDLFCFYNFSYTVKTTNFSIIDSLILPLFFLKIVLISLYWH